MTIQTPQQAKAIEAKLISRIDLVERKIDAAAQSGAADFSALAHGEEIDSGDLVKLQAELRVLEEALTSAKEAVRNAERVAASRPAIERLDEARRLLADRVDLGGQISGHLQAYAGLVNALMQNSRQLSAAIRPGANANSPKGYVVFDHALLHLDHVQHTTSVHLARVIPGWRYERLPPHGGPSFGEAIHGACEAFGNELDILVGASDLDPSDVAAIRAEQAQQQQLEEQ
jgi:hypothetical protein